MTADTLARTPFSRLVSYKNPSAPSGMGLAISTGARHGASELGQLPPCGSRLQRMTNQTTNQHLAKPFMWLVIVTGGVACVASLLMLRPSQLAPQFVLITVLTLAFGSRVVVQIPRVKGRISVSDIFIFLSLLI